MTDLPHVGLFRKHGDAVREAHFRADLVRRRYRVKYDADNRWWRISETTTLLSGHRDFRRKR